MIFSSIEFVVFLTVVFALYWFVLNKNLKLQNALLLVASYVFYGWWDWRFLFLLIFISGSNYLIGLYIDRNDNEKIRKLWLTAGLVINLGVLCVFKYYNFFIDSFIDFIGIIGYDLTRSTTRIVLPVGISFYTFLSLSYIIDIYKKNLRAQENPIDVLLSLSFFPIILAGPIQRPSTLLPQISGKREFEYAKMVDGLRQILWGMFKKIVLADTCGANADYIFSNHSTLEGSVLVMGAVFFAFQLYGDFSGYSDIAIGTGKLLGFNLMQNFAYPYFSRDITEFWKRWHISLTQWFRDYIFLPLSFSISWKIRTGKVGFMKTDMFIYIVASLVTWFLTGLWHGANYTFIVWGMIHGIFLIVHHWQGKPRKKLLKKLGTNNNNWIVVGLETIVTLLVVLFAWIFFRADSIHEAIAYIRNIVDHGIFSLSILNLRGRGISSTLIDASIAIAVMVIIEWLQRKKQHGLEIQHYPVVLRWSIYWILAFICLIYLGNERTFIYFQF